MVNKLFSDINMNWTKVIVFAITSAIYTALVTLIPLINKTSLADIGVYLDLWFLFALIIIMNCENAKQACIKCFVFFLISQPLIYLLQVPFVLDGFKIFRYYPRWFVYTLLTVPMSLIAYQIKKQNLLSAIIISFVSIYMGYQAVIYLKMTIANFPFHILSAIACILLSLLFSFSLIKNKKYRLIPITLMIIAFLVSSFINNLWVKDGYYEVELGNGNWTSFNENEDIVSISIENNVATFKTESNGLAYVYFIDENGIKQEYYINVNGNEIFVSKVE